MMSHAVIGLVVMLQQSPLDALFEIKMRPRVCPRGANRTLPDWVYPSPRMHKGVFHEKHPPRWLRLAGRAHPAPESPAFPAPPETLSRLRRLSASRRCSDPQAGRWGEGCYLGREDRAQTGSAKST